MTRLIQHTLDQLAISNRDIFDIVFSLGLSLFIAFIISQIYKFTHRGLNYELSFMTTLVLLAPIVASVMLFIRGDLVLSLGLIGSLSIIRFRTPIKDTRDMVFLFWVISVGLGSGTYNWIIVIISTIVIAFIMFLLHFIKYGLTKSKDFVLVISGEGDFVAQDLNNTVKKYTSLARIRSQENDDLLWEVVYELRFNRLTSETTENMVNDLRKVSGVRKVSLLAPQLALPV